MNIITYNARGLGRGVKWPAIRRLVNKQHVDMLCIQETKKELIDRDICHALWGDPDVQWADQPATHTAGGILCLWSDKVFDDVEDAFSIIDSEVWCGGELSECPREEL